MSSYRTLFEIGKSLVAETDIDKLLPLAMDKVIAETEAQRGILTILGADGELLFESARNFDQKDIERPEFEISKTVIDRVLESGKPAVIRNALDEPELAGSGSIARLKVLSVACAPLCSGEQVIGAIYIDNRDLTAVFSEETGRLLNEFAALISVAIQNALERRRLLEQQLELRTALEHSQGYGEIIGNSPAMQEVFALIEKVAGKDITVLITGETGTGKELVAREVQRRSLRKNREFVTFSCANVPEQLLESELFGHEKGAFTGADRRKRGLFEIAHRGTVFLDEVGEMSPASQAKMLRFLQSGEFKPLGTEATKTADVRIIAATNRDLPAMISQGTFREDLYYRLNVIDIKLPPLRDRGQDVLLIAQYLLEHYARQFSVPVRAFSEAAQELLTQYHFPGNVRELVNIVQRAVALADGESITPGDLTSLQSAKEKTSQSSTSVSSFSRTKQAMIEKFERDFVCARLKETGGNISEAARRAGMHKKNFIQKMQQYDINREDFV